MGLFIVALCCHFCATNYVESANCRTQLGGTAAAPHGIKMKHFLPVTTNECTFIFIKALLCSNSKMCIHKHLKTLRSAL